MCAPLAKVKLAQGAHICTEDLPISSLKRLLLFRRRNVNSEFADRRSIFLGMEGNDDTATGYLRDIGIFPNAMDAVGRASGAIRAFTLDAAHGLCTDRYLVMGPVVEVHLGQRAC